MITLKSNIQIYFDPFNASSADLTNSTNFFTLDFVANVEIVSSVDTLTDIAVIKIPKKLTYKKNGKEVSNLIAGDSTIFFRGQKIVINLGYNYNIGQPDNMSMLFSGYISHVEPNNEIIIYCEDPMFKLKQFYNNSFSKTSDDNIKLSDILKYILPSWASANMVCIDATLGGYRIQAGNSAAYELDRLMSAGFSFNFKNGIFYAGLRYVTADPTLAKITPLTYEKNIISDSDMIYRRKDDLGFTLKCISTNDKNVVVGPLWFNSLTPNGSLTGKAYGEVINYKNNTGMDLATLTKVGQEIYNKRMYEGFQGSVTTFLQPTVNAGDAVKLIHNTVPEKNGIYLVKQVSTNFGEGGRQEIFLDRKIG